MNLDGLTNDQRTGVLHLEGPLLISAGAGSGKTFTLTQRIAHALLQGSVVDDIDGILAITFTEKAAGEIKARVRSTLHREGLSEQAHKVDAAWISTIHGMCARILRTHALELGIDPGFGVIEDTVRKEMIAQAINEVLEKSREDIALQSLVGGGISRTGALRGDAMRVRYAALFNEFVPRSVFPTQSSVVSMLETLLDKAANLGGGYDDFVFGPAPTKLEILARDLVRAYHEVLPFLEQAQNSKSAIDARVDAIRVVEVLEGLLKDWKKADAQVVARGVDASTGTFAPAEEDASERLSVFADTLEGCLLIGRNFGSAEVKEAVGEWKQVYLRIVHEVVCALARPALDDLMALVREVEECYVDAKRKAFVFDNDDLLIETLRAFEAHPPLVDHYQEQFKLVMVDEFQDTSQIQIDIIEKLAGQNSGKLCTVGDSQQSIYRFRGADVNVYEEHKNKMRAPAIGARYVELRKNFRSHGDILRFVDRVFEQPQVFGERFMSLEPHEERASSYHATTPRVDVLLTTRPGASGSGITVDDARRKEAQAIASRFAAFRAAGHDAKDMVVLLGKLTRAEVFAQAIRDEGFECVIAGGSLFDKAAEVQVVARFVEVLANPANTRALFEVLAGDMFRLCADDFLQLTTTYDSARGGLVRRSLERGLYQVTLLSKETSKPPSPHDTQALPARLRNAARILDRAKNSLGSESVAHIVEEALVDSGWITRLEGAGAQGMAQAANILKAVRHLKELEHKRKLGISRLAQEFRSELDLGLKEAPGALSGADTGVVKIMSIHASKGLEFPLVALADFSGIPPFRNALLVETCDGSAYVSLGLRETFNRYPTLQKRLAGFEPFEEGESAHVYAHFLKTATDQAEFRAALKSFAHAEELEEVRRKFYVGLTRASEALVIAASVRLSAKEPELAYRDVIADMRSALCGTQDFPYGKAVLEYGGSQPAAFKRIVLDEAVHLDEQDARPLSGVSNVSQMSFFVPDETERRKPSLVRYRREREGVFSYSALAQKKHDFDTSGTKDGSASQHAHRQAGLGGGVGGDDAGGAAAGVVRGATQGIDLEEAALEEVPVFRMNSDFDKASDLGSAFHQLAQYALDTKGIPSPKHVEQIARAHNLSEEQRLRLTRALAAWFASDVYAHFADYALVRAELSFFVSVDKAWLEGEIDAFCSRGLHEKALVIDYKTGGTPHETPEELFEKHLLQATCYAYAVLTQGYPEVELQFVRVEHLPISASEEGKGEDSLGIPLVRYHFTHDELPQLKQRIIEGYARLAKP